MKKQCLVFVISCAWLFFFTGLPANVNADTPCFTPNDLEAAYQQGYEARLSACAAGDSECATYNLFSNVLHIPCLDLGEKYWLDLFLDVTSSADPLLFEVTGFGAAPTQTLEDLDPAACYTQDDVDAAHRLGYEAGVTGCGAGGECAVFDIFTNTLHVPCIDLGAKYWLDFSMRASDPVMLELVGFGGVPTQTSDDKLLRVAEKVPGFGGMFMGADRVLNVYLKDTSQSATASVLAAIVDIYGADFIPSGGIQPILAQYDFSELIGWHKLHRATTLALPGVVSTGVDDKSNRLKVKLSDMAMQTQVEQELTEMGVPLEAVIFEISSPVEFYDAPSLRDKIRPLIGGIQIARWGATCTLGFLAVRNGEPGFVTNSHCMVAQGGLLGTDMFQPVTGAAANLIGREVVDPQYSTGGNCPSGRRCRHSDCAFLRREMATTADSVPVAADFGFLALPYNYASGGMTLDSKVRINKESSNIVEGMIVQRVGRTTGARQGEVIDTCEDVNVNQSDVTLFCQHRVAAQSDHGDSGSPVFTWSSATLPPGAYIPATLLGIQWGGNGAGEFVFSDMTAVQSELGALRTHIGESGANSPPQIKITSPSNFAHVGFGGLNIENYEVELADYEDKETCCQVSWSSDIDGLMGGGKNIYYTIMTPGTHTITATATDSQGGVSTDSITLFALGDAPDVFINKPSSGQSFLINTPVNFKGSSSDLNEPAQMLPCSSMTWTSSVAADPFPITGCDVQATFHTAGTRTIKLTGVDSQGNDDTASVYIIVTNPSPNTPPSVWISYPGEGYALKPWDQVLLRGGANDPDDKSPINLRWTIKVGATETTIGTGSVADGKEHIQPWIPSTHVPEYMGGQTVQLRLYATDADGMSKSTSVNISVLYPPR